MITMFPGDRVRLRFVAMPETCGTLLSVHAGRALIDWDDGVIASALVERVEPISPWREWPATLDDACDCCGKKSERLFEVERTLMIEGNLTESSALYKLVMGD